MSTAQRIQRVVAYRKGDKQFHVAIAVQTDHVFPESVQEDAALVLADAVDRMIGVIENITPSRFEKFVDESHHSGFQHFETTDDAPGFMVAHGFATCAAEYHDFTFSTQGAYRNVMGRRTLVGVFAYVFGEHAKSFQRTVSLFRQARTGVDPL